MCPVWVVFWLGGAVLGLLKLGGLGFEPGKIVCLKRAVLVGIAGIDLFETMVLVGHTFLPI